MLAESTMPNEANLPYLNGLNAPQVEAVTTLSGPLLVLAGAGTGKTRVLTTRIAHILYTNQAYPHEILAVTFTNKAANEMKHRVGQLLHSEVEGWWIGTFHALSTRILRKHAHKLGYDNNFTILDYNDQLRLAKQVLAAENISEKSLTPAHLVYTIQSWKDKGWRPQEVILNFQDQKLFGRLKDLYALYQSRLEHLNAMDFGDLILQTLVLFTQAPEICTAYQQQFKYIMVDEYQDTNLAQYLWLKALTHNHHDICNICCVGDEDQSIYGWRGAEIGNILRFPKEFKNAKIIRLEENYRSTPEILHAAATLISHNQQRIGKTLWTGRKSGEKIWVKSCFNDEEESYFVAKTIETLSQTQQKPLHNMAILVRASFQTRSFEERLLSFGIPYQIIGGLRFYDRAEIRDILAYFRLVVQTTDDLAFERIINVPKRGLGEATLQNLHAFAREHQCSLWHAATVMRTQHILKPSVHKSISQFQESIMRWQQNMATKPLIEQAEIIIEESGYTDYLRQQNKTSLDLESKRDNLKELINALKPFDSLQGYLEHVSLVTDHERDQSLSDKVMIMTLHAAKGLEFDTVFLPGWEEGIFPNQRSLEEKGNIGLEEERRLAYVGITRARRHAIISFAARRYRYNSYIYAAPSSFIHELPQEVVNTLVAAPHPQVPTKPAVKTIEPHKIRAQHPVFGIGHILQDKGDKFVIAFPEHGIKTILKSFVTLHH